MQTETDNYVVAEGLSLNVPLGLDSTFQILPSYDDTENVLILWDGDIPLYFLSFLKLPEGWQDANKWLPGVLNEMRTLSVGRQIEIINQGVLSAQDNFKVHYVEAQYQLNGEQETTHQIVNFITNGQDSYASYATPTHIDDPTMMLEETKVILSSACQPKGNIAPLVRKTEDRFSGQWSGFFRSDECSFSIVLTLLNDFRFTCIESGKKKPCSFSGAWSINGDRLELHHLYGVLPHERILNTLHLPCILEYTGLSMTLATQDHQLKVTLVKSEG